MSESEETIEFSSPSDLAGHLYDRALEPWMTGSDRLHLAIYSAICARRLWRTYR